jgi:hypothetical protein
MAEQVEQTWDVGESVAAKRVVETRIGDGLEEVVWDGEEQLFCCSTKGAGSSV